MLDLVQLLCSRRGASGYEDSLRTFIAERAAFYAQSIRTDSMGNLIVFKRGIRPTGKKLMLVAHMDEVGLMVRSITEDGYIKFVTLGGIDRRILPGKSVRIGSRGLPGVIGLKAYHLVSSAEGDKMPELSDLYIDIGAESREAVTALISLGDVIHFEQRSGRFGNGLIRAKALDDRIGCALLLSLLEETLPMDCTFVFTVQEEVGTRGAFGAAFAVKPEIALVVEGTTAADLPNMDEHKMVCRLGEGPVIPFMDGATVYDRGLFELLRKLAERLQIPWQTKHLIAGGTDAGAIQRSREGVRVAGISAAVRYLHTPTGLANETDILDMQRLIRAFIEAIAMRPS